MKEGFWLRTHPTGDVSCPYADISLFPAIEQRPSQVPAVAKPLTVSTLLPSPFADSPRETMVVCIGQN